MRSCLTSFLAAFSFLLCLIAGALWVRSTQAFDELTTTAGRNFRIISAGSSVSFRLVTVQGQTPPARALRWYSSTSSTGVSTGDLLDQPPHLSQTLTHFAAGPIEY